MQEMRQEQGVTRQVLAAYDQEGVYVYQAFKDAIVDAALTSGTFGTGFNMERMTWIKPSFGWMLYRSGYATKRRQTRILRIKITHEGWHTILRDAVPTSFAPQRFMDQAAWRRALRASEARYQWDPERDLLLHRLSHIRAIQVGIRGSLVDRYVHDWIIDLQDVTPAARRLQQLCEQGLSDEHALRECYMAQAESLPPLLEERVYLVPSEIRSVLGIELE